MPPEPGRAVPRDPDRRYMDHLHAKTSGQAGRRARLRLRRPRRATPPPNGHAGYYSFSPRKGFRFISHRHRVPRAVCRLGSSGNIDAPQFRWIERELTAAAEGATSWCPLRPPPDPQPRPTAPDENAGPCALTTATGTARAATATRASRTPDPPGRRPPAAAARAPARDRQRGRPHPRAQDHRVPADGRTAAGSGGSRPPRSRLADPVPPDRGHGQPRRHALDLRHDHRPRRRALRPRRRARRPTASARRRWPHWRASSPSTIRRSASRRRRSAASTTATSSC